MRSLMSGVWVVMPGIQLNPRSDQPGRAMLIYLCFRWGTMQKIASPQELSAELHRLLAYCSGTERPSREKLASELRELADRVAGQIRWQERDDAKGHRWVADVADPNGDKWAWQIVEFQGPGTLLYRVTVLDPDGQMLKWKKQPKTLKEAQKFAESWAKSTNSGASMIMTNDFVRMAGLAPAPWETGPSSGPTMMKFHDERAAKKEAHERRAYYGWSVLSHGWYVGTVEQLKKIGVSHPERG